MKRKYSIGIGFNLFDARAILMNEDAEIISHIEKRRKTLRANESLDILQELCVGIISRAKKYKDQISGIGIALGGIVNAKTGIVYWPEKQKESYVYIALPLKKYLEKKFGVPIIIDNDANACVWAEYIKNFPNYKNIIYMFSGVGCGLIIDGKLYRGRDGGAGELFILPKSKENSHLGDFSFLKQWPIDLDIEKRAKEMISRSGETSLLKKITPTGELFLKDIFDDANKKDKIAKEALKEGSFALGVKIAFLVNLLNPELVIIGGGMEEAGDAFLEQCVQTIKDFSFSEMRKNLQINFSQLGREAICLGAALLASKV